MVLRWKYALLSLLMSMVVGTAWGQIKIMEKPKAKGLLVEKYDSLTNFEEKYYGQNNPNYNKLSYHHLIGQTILYCGSQFKKCKYGEYYKISSIITKNGLPYFVLINKKTKQRIEITGIMYNSQFVVQGHYEKLKQLYIGKKYLYSSYNGGAMIQFYDVKTGNYSKIDDGTIWICTDIQVEDRRVSSHSGKFSPLLLVFTSEDNRKSIYCYNEAFYDMEDISNLSDNNTSEQHYKSKNAEEYGSKTLNDQLKVGMTKQMIISLYGNPKPSSKSVSVSIINGKIHKEETWIYDIETGDGGNPMKLTLVFDEKEELKNWILE